MTVNKNDVAAYAGYVAWKSWLNPFQHGSDDAAYFRKEFRGINLRDQSVLEIGFGEGRFLSWALAQGAKIHGTELIPAMRVAAKKFGVTLLPEDLAEATSQFEAKFDLIVALDVAEHWTLDQLSRNLILIQRLLKPNGKLLLRFPNGQSPFGLAPQNSDPTHRSALSKALFDNLLVGQELSIARYGPQARYLGRNPIKAAIRSLRYGARMCLSAILNFIYASDFPWDEVVTLVLIKRGPPTP
jgi:2-polyprenyl-3-methyl-5-hydroxy-6-metoxy-1,4-benzoquinol methylase